MLAQLRNRGGFPVPRAQPRAEVVQPIYRRAVARQSAGRRRRRRCRATARRRRMVPLDSSDCTSGSATRADAALRAGAVDDPVHEPGARARGAARPPDDFDGIVEFVHFFEPARVDVENAGARQRSHGAQRSGRHAVAIHFPRRADVAQEPRALRVRSSARHCAAQLSARECQHFAPVTAGAVDRFGQRAKGPHEASRRAARRLERAGDIGLDRRQRRSKPAAPGIHPWRDSTWMFLTRGRRAASRSAASTIVRPLPTSSTLPMSS